MNDARLSAAVLLAGCLAVMDLVSAPPPLVLKPCDIPGVKDKARCGTYEVWENRDAKSGRRIGLKVIVLPATGANPEKDAVMFLAGGPGDAATRAAPFVAGMFAGIRQHRDLLFVDQRGTGGSHALDCDLYPGTDPQAALGAFFPLDRVRACRAAFEKNSDLRQYTTANSVDDLDEVRGALGYERLDVVGGSYGTRVALEFIRRHSDRTRIAILQGVDPPGDPAPLNFPQHAQRAIERVFNDCAAEAACRAAFPNLPSELDAIVKRTVASPVSVEILDSKTGDPVRVSLSRNLLGEGLRYLMYQSATAVFLPDLVHQAAGGDFSPVAEFALGSRRQVVNGIGTGLYLSVTCAEDLPFIAAAEAARAATNTFLGDYRYRDQQAACGAWVRGSVPSDVHQPVRSDVPVLMFSGAWDPVTPPSNAEQAARTLPRSLAVTIPSGGHDYQGLQGVEACMAKVMTQFVERGSVDGLDTSCVNAIQRSPFPTAPVRTKAVSLSGEAMAGFAGHYVAQGAPPLDVRLENGKLRAHLTGEDTPLVLVPVSATRLRVLGDVASYLDCELQAGKVAKLTLERGGTKLISWTRTQDLRLKP